jgi:DNA polymerase-3 subunit delta'
MAGFQEIIGHEQIIGHLKSAVALDKVSHAYILNGPEKSGKRMLAEAFAMALQCETVQEKLASAAQWGEAVSASMIEPCMHCRSCKQAVGHNQPDILYLVHEKPNTISVDDVRRQINQDIGVKPYSSKYKIYIVDEAEKMNIQAQNALLKTIEEPPAYAVILLLTTNADGFLPTILSRCVTLDLKAVENGKIRQFLMKNCQVPDYKADICVAFAQGNVGRAMMLAASEQFNELKDFSVQLLRRVKDIPNYDLLQEIKPLNDFKENIQDFLDLLLLWYRDVLLYKASGQEERLVFQEQTYEVEHQADIITYPGIQTILEAIETAGRRIRANVNFELALELLLLTIKENIT